MVGVAEAIGLISSMISIAEQLVRLAERAQRNREMCAQLKNHVRMISRLLTELRSQWMPDPVTYSMLKNLSDALNDGKALVASCLEKRTWSLVFKTQKKAKKIARRRRTHLKEPRASQKEELKSSIKNLTNMDNMSTDAKRRPCTRYGGGAIAAGSSSSRRIVAVGRQR
nr:unnamed protein product [Digitaria exilis]